MAAALEAMPPSVTVGLGPGRKIVILVEGKKFAPAIEAAASGLWAVFLFVRQELEGCEGSGRQPRPGRQGSDKRAPRGPEGRRQYFDSKRNRWVQKGRKPGGKHRVLTRKATPPSPRAALQAALLCGASFAEDSDCDDPFSSEAHSSGASGPLTSQDCFDHGFAPLESDTS